MYARHLLVVWLGVILMTGWFGCERITSTIKSESQLSPADLPKRGVSVLPDFGKPVPEIRIAPAGDARGKSGGTLLTDQHELPFDRAELRAYIESIADIYKERYISLFVVADSVGNVYRYGYRPIFFHRNEEQLSRGEREMYVYIHPNSEQDGVWRMNIALIPKTPSALDGFRRWILPRYKKSLTEENQSSKLKSESLIAGFMECTWHTEVVIVEAPGYLRYDFYHCETCTSPSTNEIENDDFGGGQGSCWTCDDPGGGGGPYSCPNDPNAHVDRCGRCVGGNTGLIPAPEGTDCNNLNLPCAGDVVKDPRIAPQRNSGINGGRYGFTRSGGSQYHSGLDIATSFGASIFSMFSGQVVSVGNDAEGLGYFVTVQSLINGKYYTIQYTHLQQTGRPHNGSQIAAGTIIGTQGDSGNLARAIRRGYTEYHTHIIVSERTGTGWHLVNDYSRVNPENIMRTKFDQTGNPTNPRNCNSN